jgi:hypothetical protein
METNVDYLFPIYVIQKCLVWSFPVKIGDKITLDCPYLKCVTTIHYVNHMIELCLCQKGMGRNQTHPDMVGSIRER